MNRYIRVALGVLLIFATATLASAATEQQKMEAINKGLAYLATTQQANGSWYYGGYEQAATGAAVLAFLSQKDNWGANSSAYQAVVDNAVAYLLLTASTTTVSLRADGANICPGGTGTCPGVYWYGAGETTYTTGLVAPALVTYALGHAGDIATSAGPLAGMTWLQIAQGITNTFSAGQSVYGVFDGGWRYFPGEGDADSSTTQWAVISLIYDQQLGASTPATVKDHLRTWLSRVQAGSGAGCYMPGSEPCDHSDTGSLLLGLKFVGYDLSNPQVVNAINFLNNNWATVPYGTWYGNFGHMYAMWGVYKGLETNIGLADNSHITALSTTCGAPGNLPGNPPGSVPCNWWQDYNEYLVNAQNADGSWPGYAYWYGPLSTAWAINILSATLVPVGNPVLDDFNRANGPLGPNWSGGVGGYFIVDNQAFPKSGGAIYWNRDTFGVSQEAFVTLPKIDRYASDIDLLLKVQKTPEGTINYKRGFIQAWYNHKLKFVTVATMLPGGTWYQYKPVISATFLPGDKFGAKVLSNGEVHLLKNGADLGVVVLNAKDQAFFNGLGGSIGLWFVSDPDGYFDDFGGGNL